MAISPQHIEQSVDASLLWLAGQHNENWLLLFDNADDTKLKLNNFFPKCRHGNILITTRNQELVGCTTKDAHVNIGGMDQEDAKQLLLNLAHIGVDDTDSSLAESIVEDLHYFALAISQAGAYICCQQLSLKKYQKLYEKEHDNLLQNITLQGQDSSSYSKAVYTTWKLSYDKLDEPAQKFLQACCFLHHTGISETIFKKAASSSGMHFLQDTELKSHIGQLLNLWGETRKFKVELLDFQENVIKSLKSYSLLEYDKINEMYSMHPLVKQWCKTTLQNNKTLMQKCVFGIVSLSIMKTAELKATNTTKHCYHIYWIAQYYLI